MRSVVPHKSVFRILDLYKVFMSAFKQKHQDGRSKFEKPFESCSVGLNGYSCGDVDARIQSHRSFGTCYILHKVGGVQFIQL
ncbi:hypothetical protein Patl1_05911 [Pistacia atlantica]|uniref:Uncharacterized protein n=1 Tax=Pistacia atlantica TaxID=434234 RepID=A0ACC1BRP3_9ROSI|nr:hypothetical protein Patl1_05911 [Pistacia atlantica]